jgi:hypothetical protein
LSVPAGRSSICPVDSTPAPSGDYGYDLAHEDARSAARSEDRPGAEHPRPAPSRPADAGGDYGYDEAHGF